MILSFIETCVGFRISVDISVVASDINVFIDASLKGLGAVCENQFYSVSLPYHFVKPECIVVFEMVNILVALKMWGNEWYNKTVTINYDNKAMVEILKNNRLGMGNLG